MATKNLDFIASTPVRNRRPVMPRIYCKDGVSLSVQASERHYSYGKTASGEIIRKSDEGPWYALEVGFLLHAEVPKEWPFIENHHSALSLHDPLGVPTDIVNPVYCVDTVELRKFIEAHGGEADDLHSAIVGLREIIDQKWIEFERAKEKEHAIWDIHISEVLGLVPDTIDQTEAERLILEKYAGEYGAALKDAQRLFDEWLALTERHNFLDKQELAELEREIENAGK